ncbi:MULTISPECIES: 4-oxalocrotonate decarboxylase [unclassified Streptomyces]|uniref:2-keto-4-pentenoate hydratase n=1 Tax=unclassified Streptomyces TaxID=2593676 RepID=UPI0001C1B5B2|nr:MULTISPECIES: 4-oxalocrotonate decarboxylase [unclassified Streptomyces]AEN11953.1 4-oxalocrotonate decarboxylase [Streptomyces sp. SirexAA-E]MYR67204.1 4-oxalocrotonate decarboxylase [Streptomyces sp. SID4939]MYS02000.1 4-oxalocrotonate decarboxylase [Streptomyces sp. SID4940]MYT65231.1 4-oxalocrotonate decarboxylase [Streptomyces sp. SID8357]MYT84893.1 4-oxalocrotonate decarboxylase [Streptomyces sp. SID8360]
MIPARTIDTLAERLDTAQTSRTETPSLADTHAFGIDDAYAIQAALLARRAARGERLTGVKLGFTSKAKMAQMGVSDVIVGRLTDAMRVPDGGDLDLSRFIHPKVEPEVAYRLCRDVDLDDPATDIESCVDAVAPALEIIDSRYEDFRFTYGDVVADNTSAAAYVIGPWRPVESVSNRAVRLLVGTTVVTGSTAAVLGDPVRALHALLDMCRRRSIPLRAGQAVLAGAATAAVPLTTGVTSCDVAGIGAVSVRGVR